jgi:hypothetical protein
MPFKTVELEVRKQYSHTVTSIFMADYLIVSMALVSQHHLSVISMGDSYHVYCMR